MSEMLPWTCPHCSNGKEYCTCNETKEVRTWIIFDGCSREPTIQGPPIAYAETIRVVEASALQECQEKLQFLNDNCISLSLHENRVKNLEDEVEAERKICDELVKTLEDIYKSTSDYLVENPANKALKAYRESRKI